MGWAQVELNLTQLAMLTLQRARNIQGSKISSQSNVSKEMALKQEGLWSPFLKLVPAQALQELTMGVAALRIVQMEMP